MKVGTRSVSSHPVGRNGTANTATACVTIGAARTTCSRNSPSGFTSSSDLYKADNRNPTASINFITAPHDGFTLNDLSSLYNERHNEANKEDNKDGAMDNRSWNCGAEGPTDDANINTLRGRQKRNLLATLLLSQGCAHVIGRRRAGP